jgi:hypothetical protein
MLSATPLSPSTPKGHTMSVSRLICYVASVVAFLNAPTSRDERGLSQSTETAILIAAALAVAAAIVGAVTVFVSSKLAGLG